MPVLDHSAIRAGPGCYGTSQTDAANIYLQDLGALPILFDFYYMPQCESIFKTGML